jgi:hypothetical protein
LLFYPFSITPILLCYSGRDKRQWCAIGSLLLATRDNCVSSQLCIQLHYIGSLKFHFIWMLCHEYCEMLSVGTFVFCSYFWEGQWGYLPWWSLSFMNSLKMYLIFKDVNLKSCLIILLIQMHLFLPKIHYGKNFLIISTLCSLEYPYNVT